MHNINPISLSFHPTCQNQPLPRRDLFPLPWLRPGLYGPFTCGWMAPGDDAADWKTCFISCDSSSWGSGLDTDCSAGELPTNACKITVASGTLTARANACSTLFVAPVAGAGGGCGWLAPLSPLLPCRFIAMLHTHTHTHTHTHINYIQQAAHSLWCPAGRTAT